MLLVRFHSSVYILIYSLMHMIPCSTENIAAGFVHQLDTFLSILFGKLHIGSNTLAPFIVRVSLLAGDVSPMHSIKYGVTNHSKG